MQFRTHKITVRSNYQSTNDVYNGYQTEHLIAKMPQHASEPNSVILKMKAVNYSETSEQTKYTRHGVKTPTTIWNGIF